MPGAAGAPSDGAVDDGLAGRGVRRRACAVED